MEELAKILYEAYCRQVGWRSFNGDSLSSWDELRERHPEICDAWLTAAEAAGDYYRGS